MNVKQAQQFINKQEIMDKIMQLTPETARKIGIKHRSALAYLKKKAKEGKLNFKSRNVRRVTNVLT